MLGLVSTWVLERHATTAGGPAVAAAQQLVRKELQSANKHRSNVRHPSKQTMAVACSEASKSPMFMPCRPKHVAMHVEAVNAARCTAQHLTL